MKDGGLKKIGGEFEINPSSLDGISDYEPSKDIFLYSSGRSALMAILKNVARTKPRKIHIPYYICQSVMNACTFGGFEVSFYEPNDGFLFPLEYLEDIKQGESLLTINYFGFVDDNPVIESIKKTRPDIVTISDHSQSFWTYKKSIADYSFTSLRKHFPVPDGALVHSQNVLFENKPSILVNSFYYPKMLGSILKWLKHEDKLYLDYLLDGEKILDCDRNITRASLAAQFVFENINFEHIKQRRKNNTQIVYELGEKAGLEFVFPYNKDTIPMHVPIIIKNRDINRANLFQNNIFPPVHWSINEFNIISHLSVKMARQELSLIVDQRYTSKEMHHQVSFIML